MQGIMPLIGWLITGEFSVYIKSWDHWIAFILLLFLGGKMIYGALKEGKEEERNEECNTFSLTKAVLMGIATSIDALIAGVALALVTIDIVEGSQTQNVLFAIGIIFLVTFLASIVGLMIGKGIGKRLNLGTKSEIIGGIILILIGAKVLYEHLGEDNAIPAQLKTEQSDTRAKVICFNIRLAHSGDGEYYWDNRREAIVRMIETENPEFLGIQEGLSQQVSYLDSTLCNYSYIGVGRDDGADMGEYCAIYFDTTKVIKHQSENFWLCPTPDSPALGWDAACVRIATWGEFSLKSEPEKRFFVINTHFDHVGVEARAKSGEMIIAFVDSIASGAPMILMGDFNAKIDDNSLSPILEKLNDSRPKDSDQTPYTFTGFGELSEWASVIDHIFTRGMKTQNYRVIMDNYSSPCSQLSDHLPVAVEFYDVL